MRDPANMADVGLLQPDYMGFIFYPKSPRYVGDHLEIPDDFPTNIIRVGVFVNESTEVIERLAARYNFHFLQLHGAETVKQCEELKGRNFKIIKAFSIDDSFDFEATKYYSAATDFYLFDTKGKYHGGNATAFNWSMLKQYDQHKPFFLSGGLSMANIASVSDLMKMNIHALDVNSGVENSPALKDLAKVREVVKLITDLNKTI